MLRVGTAGQSKTTVPVVTVSGRNSRIHTNFQEMARRMILGAGSRGGESADGRLRS